jgi:hypothetical protein
MKDATTTLIKTSVFDTIKVVESAWTGHNPFAHWLIQNLAPKVLVELGTHNGNSFFAFCQSVLEAGSQTKCYAVDTWEGDEHAGIYEDTVYEEVLRHNQSHYSAFSELIRGTFDSAVDRFEDATIDILHIDGLHTYEAVRHDFETWSPKVSKKGLILFHDTCVIERGFGVWKLWEELSHEFPNHFEFTHAYGLGVLNLDKDHKHHVIIELNDIKKNHGDIFSVFGKHQCNILELRRRDHEIETLSEIVASRDSQIALVQGVIAEKEGVIAEMEGVIAEKDGVIAEKEGVIAEKEGVIAEKEGVIAEKEGVIAEKVREIGVLSESMVSRNEQLTELLGQLREREGVITEKAREIEVLRNQISYRDHDLYHLRLYLEMVKSSWSWRLSYPLRAIDEKLKSTITTLKRYRMAAWIIWTHRMTGIFDPEWYLQSNPDVRASGMNPWWHFGKHGVYEGRSPNPSFNENYYLIKNPDIAHSVIPGTYHFIVKGYNEGRRSANNKELQLQKNKRKNSIIISGEPDSAGHFYRVNHLEELLNICGFKTNIIKVSEIKNVVGQENNIYLLWVWRVPYSKDLETIINKTRSEGGVVIYDLDDLMFEPELATTNIIDGIRSGKYLESDVKKHYIKIRDAMMASDAFSASTKFLASAMRKYFSSCAIIPNGFNDYSHDQATIAYRNKSSHNDKKIRIVYASGTLTHQKDFKQASLGIAKSLKENKNIELVLFQKYGSALLNTDEFPELEPVKKQIVVRDFVDPKKLASELALYDINIAPLEYGNRYVEAKSEIKYIDAAIARVPTIASPTETFKDAITHGENGLIAATPEEWSNCINLLASDKEKREKIGYNAYINVVTEYSMINKAQKLEDYITIITGDANAQSRAFRNNITKSGFNKNIPILSSRTIYEYKTNRRSAVSVVVPLYNYSKFVEEALDSVASQCFQDIDMVIVDDASTDDSLNVVHNWCLKNKTRFSRVILFSNYKNSGLGMTRNKCFYEAESLYVFPLDADNRIDKSCINSLYNKLIGCNAAFAYPFIQHIGDSNAVMGYQTWNPLLLACDNYIDAMALVNKSAWSKVGGYQTERTGWEDYEFWCKIASVGYWGVMDANAKAYYRVHSNSMLKTEHNSSKIKSVVGSIKKIHPWLDLSSYVQ